MFMLDKDLLASDNAFVAAAAVQHFTGLALSLFRKVHGSNANQKIKIV